MKNITFFALFPLLTCLAQDLPVDKSMPVASQEEEVDNRNHNLALASVIPGKVIHTDPIPEPEEDDDVIDNRDPNIPLANMIQVRSAADHSNADFDFTADIASAARTAATAGIDFPKRNYSAPEVAANSNIEDLPDAMIWPMDQEPVLAADGSVLNRPSFNDQPRSNPQPVLNPAPVFRSQPTFSPSDFAAQPIPAAQPAYTPEQPLSLSSNATKGSGEFQVQGSPPVYQNTLVKFSEPTDPTKPTKLTPVSTQPVKKKLGAKRIAAPKFTRAYSARLNTPAVSRRVTSSPGKRTGTLAELFSSNR